MCCSIGKWRLDLYLMMLYQITLFFSVQLLYSIFLEYMPTTYCNEENYCYKMNSKCLTDYDDYKDNLCSNDTMEFMQCVAEKKKVDFLSAQFEYQQDCKGWKSFSSSTSTFIGTLLGNIVLGYLSDQIGRRPVYIAAVLLGVPAIVLAAFVPGILPFYIFRGITGFAVAGTLTVGWTYGSEMISPERRFRLRTFPNWANARMLQVIVAYLAGEWKLTSYICASISLLIIPMIWFLPESPVFLEQKKRYKQSDEALEKIARIDNVEYVPKERKKSKPLKKITLLKLIRNPTLRTSFFLLCWMWFYNGMTIYITDLNGGDMSKNFYIGQFFSGLMLSLSKILVGIAEPRFEWIGRRLVFLVSQAIAILSYIIILFALNTENKATSWYTITYMMAYASQSLCLETCYLALAELMPTNVRSTAGSITNILMKLGSILASMAKPLKFWYEPAIFWINLITSLLGMTAVFLYLPESKNVNLQMVGQDDMSDDEDDVGGSSEVSSTGSNISSTENTNQSETCKTSIKSETE